MNWWRGYLFLTGFCWLLAGESLSVRGNEQNVAPFNSVHLAGSFNDWKTADPAWRMTYAGDQVYVLRKFFVAGDYKFKFTINGGWDRHFGVGPSGLLTQPGSEIPLQVRHHGAYKITMDAQAHRWNLEEATLDSPHAVIKVRGRAEVNLPFVLDGSESVAREGRAVVAYEFGQDTNSVAIAGLLHLGTNSPQATVQLPKEGNYEFWLRVNDGEWSEREPVRLQAQASYQVVGDWTAPDPKNEATFMRPTAPGEFEKILKSFEPGEQQLILIKNHDAGEMLNNLTVNVAQTNQQFWLVRYLEKSKEFTCKAENYVEFVYRPGEDPILQDRVEARTVNLAGTFNGWNAEATPMADSGDGTYFVYLKLDEGLHHYKFVVNGNVWMQDPNADPALRGDDEHGGFNSGIFVGERGQDYGPPPRDDINFAALRHRPDSARYFNVVSSDMAQVELRTLRGDASQVILHVVDGSERDIPMQVRDTAIGFDYWTATVVSSHYGKPISYYFTLTDGKTTKTFDAGSGGEPAQGPRAFTAEFAERFPTPDWAKHVVWYQIFPERFRNGSTENDPPRTLPWRWDWYKLAEGERPADNKQFSNDWYGRRFGGDFQGVINQLGYFRELGVTALYFCPVFEANSYHGYDTIDYRHISQYFGVKGDNEKVIPQETLNPVTWQWTPSDKLFLEFIQRAHEQGLKVIVDGVFNHMGKDSFALRDLLTNGVDSAYADWFDVTDWGPPVKYRSWDGGGWMPNFRKNTEKGIASDSARQYIFDITRRWMDPNSDGDPSDGIDGWRLDVAPDVPDAFWIEWRKHVKSINPRAYICGEHWGVAARNLQGDQWDAVMNYQFVYRATRYFIDQNRKISATEFDRQLKELLGTYPLQVNYVMQNLYDSHDTDRLVNMIVNPDRDYDQGNRTQDGATYNGSKPGADAYRVMKLMATFQMTFLGAPMIWYGDEAGMFGADDPTDRKPMLWKDLEPYDNPQDAVMIDVWEHYRRLIAIRNSYPALRTGLFQTLFVDDANDLYGFTRTRGEDVVVVVINNSTRDQSLEVAVPFAEGSRVIDLMSAAPVEYRLLPAESLGFPNFNKGALVRAIQFGAATAPAYTVRTGKIRIGLPRKSAAILVKQ